MILPWTIKVTLSVGALTIPGKAVRPRPIPAKARTNTWRT